MAQTVFVTEAQVKAAQMLVDRARALGREPDPATRQIAEARRGAPSTSRPGTVRFWEALDDAEREALRAVASWQTYAPGTRLMTEGERADHVVVILGGRAKVWVDENGQERILAVRGVGQLVGESGAFQPSLRSATVTALEMVWALAVRSDDFAAFVGNHPRVAGILHDQMYGRLTEGPPTSTAPSGENAGESPRRLERLSGENCTVLLTDVIEADHGRTESDRRVIREALWSIMAEALPGIPDVWKSDRGDGLLTVVPPGIPTAEVIGLLFKELPGAIERHNEGQPASPNLQLRLAINVGPVFGDAADLSGEAIVVAGRLLEAPYLKKAIANASGSLGIIVSPFIFETFIRPASLDAEASYRQTPIDIGESSTSAWMRVIAPNPAAGG